MRAGLIVFVASIAICALLLSFAYAVAKSKPCSWRLEERTVCVEGNPPNCKHWSTYKLKICPDGSVTNW